MTAETKLTLTIASQSGDQVVHVESPNQPLWTPSRNGTGPAPTPKSPPATDAELRQFIEVGLQAARDIETLNSYKDQYLHLLQRNVDNAVRTIGEAEQKLAEVVEETERLAAQSAERVRAMRVRLGEARRAAEDARGRGVAAEGPHVEAVEREYEAAEAEDRRLLTERIAFHAHLQGTVFQAVSVAVHCAERHWQRAEHRLQDLERLVEGCENARRELDRRSATYPVAAETGVSN